LDQATKGTIKANNNSGVVEYHKHGKKGYLWDDDNNEYDERNTFDAGKFLFFNCNDHGIALGLGMANGDNHGGNGKGRDLCCCFFNLGHEMKKFQFGERGDHVLKIK